MFVSRRRGWYLSVLSLLLLSASCFATMGSMAVAQEWTRFRGPSASGIASGNVPVTWDNEKNVAWKAALPGRGASSPVVMGQMADHGYASPTPCVDESFVYSSFGPSGVVALIHDGKLVWRQNVGTKTAGFGAASSPIVFDDLLIMNASIEDDAVYGIDKSTGEIRWCTEGIERAWTTPTLVTSASGETELNRR